MSMMSRMNNYSSLAGGQPVNLNVRLSDPVCQEIIDQLPGRVPEGGWDRILLTDALTPAQKTSIIALGAPEEKLSVEDSYAVFGEGSTLTVWSRNFRGHLYGLYTILQLAQSNEGNVPSGVIFNVPQCALRGLKVYLPAEDGLDEFFRAVDFLLYYRCNTVIIELGGAMEYKRHPEINESWIEYCNEMGRYPNRANEVQHMFGWAKNSIHFENGGGKWLPQDVIRILIDYCRERGMEVIPEVPSLSHADYLLNAHQELAERPYDPYPDVYCPSNPDSYKLLFDVMDEVIDLFKPNIMHIGHDECYSLALCDRCRGKDPAELYAADITKIHDYLASKGVKTMFWSEKVLNSITHTGRAYGGAEYTAKCSRNTSCHIAATHRSIDMIPRDCIAHNWYWSVMEYGDEEFHKRGIPMTFGNWSPITIHRWQERVDAGAKGCAPSHWTTLSEETLQYNGVHLEIAFGAHLQWIPGYAPEQYADLLYEAAEDIFLYKNRETLRKPHFAITHRTTASYRWHYITSAPMLLDEATIGKYVVEYTGGQTLEIPLVYGLNIANAQRSWKLIESDHWDGYNADSSLHGTTLTTLPVRRRNGETHFKIVVENPYPDEAVRAVHIVPKEGLEGDILITSFETVLPEEEFDDSSVRMHSMYS